VYFLGTSTTAWQESQVATVLYVEGDKHMAFLSQPSFTPTAKRLAVMDFDVMICIGHLY
jgi:hypothetical protein